MTKWIALYFDEGMGLTQNVDFAAHLIHEYSNVQAQTFTTEVEGYCWLCRIVGIKYYSAELARISLPTLELLKQHGAFVYEEFFNKPPKNGYELRCIVAVTHNAAGILDNISDIRNFMASYDSFTLKEADVIDEAIQFINAFYTIPLLPYFAYVKGGMPQAPSKISIGTCFSTQHYHDYYQDNISCIPYELRDARLMNSNIQLSNETWLNKLSIPEWAL